MFIKLYRSIIYNYKENGIKLLIKKFFEKLSHFFYVKKEFLIYKNDLNQIITPPSQEGIEIKLLTFEDLITYNFFKAVAYPEAIKLRFTEGATCYGFFYMNTLSHIAWMTDGYLILDGNIPRINDSDCLSIYDCYTLPDFRNKGIYNFVLEYLLWIASTQGKKTLIAVDEDNMFSRKAIEKSGFRLYYKAVYVKITFFKKISLITYPN